MYSLAYSADLGASAFKKRRRLGEVRVCDHASRWDTLSFNAEAPRSAGREKKSAKAGETACATFASPLFAVVGQAHSPANAACGRFFLTTAEYARGR
jgi:hypothetical protein